MPGSSALLGLAMILIVMVGMAFLVGFFYLGDNDLEQHHDTDPRYRGRY